MSAIRLLERAARTVALAGLIAAALFAQNSRALDPLNTYQRLLAIVPITGSGTHQDPRRPLHVPAPHEIKPGEGIIAFSSLESDDHRWALVELVARDRAAFQDILADKSIKTFERGVAKGSDIENEFGKYRKNFRLQEFHGTVVR